MIDDVREALIVGFFERFVFILDERGNLIDDICSIDAVNIASVRCVEKLVCNVVDICAFGIRDFFADFVGFHANGANDAAEGSIGSGKDGEESIRIRAEIGIADFILVLCEWVIVVAAAEVVDAHIDAFVSLGDLCVGVANNDADGNNCDERNGTGCNKFNECRGENDTRFHFAFNGDLIKIFLAIHTLIIA